MTHPVDKTRRSGHPGRVRPHNPIETAKLHSFKPDFALVSRIEDAPQDPLHYRINDLFKAEILRVAGRYLPGRTNLDTLVFGPRDFEDFPLDAMLRRGTVVGLDINEASMLKAKTRIGELSAGLTPVYIDASLYANHFIAAVRNVLFGERQLTDGLAQSLIITIDSVKPRKQLPLRSNSFDFAVSISSLGDFTAQMVNVLIVHLLWEQFGRGPVHRYYTDLTTDGAKQVMKGDLLFRSFARLHRRMVSAHAAEVARLLRPEGVALISDHDLKISVYNGSGRFSERAASFAPAQEYLEDISLTTPASWLNFEVGSKNDSLTPSGGDSLQTLLQTDKGPLRLLEKASIHNLNRPGVPMLDVPGEYFIDTMLVYRRT